MALNDRLRAAVYARDKAICAFSGLSLWVLDNGAVPWAQADWPDHVKPHSRGGADTVENLVCASYFYNSKKNQNGRDNQYLFRNGVPDTAFYWSHGGLSDQQIAMLKHHAAVVESDWYFNRALWNLVVAMNNEWQGVTRVRTTRFWIASARKRLEKWRLLAAGTQSFEARGLVATPEEPDVKLMLSLRTADSTSLTGIYQKLLRHYSANATAMDDFAGAKTQAARDRVVRKAQASRLVTRATRQALERNLAAFTAA